MKVFISGSIKIKELPESIVPTLEKIISKGHQIIIGDAVGIDSLVQEYLVKSNYRNVCIYSIYSMPRYNAGGFEHIYTPVPSDIKSERDRQKFKDRKMADDCGSFFVVWDGKSKGCLSNINSAISMGKHTKVFLQGIDSFLEQSDLSNDNIEFLYRSNVGYSASEFVDQLMSVGINAFKNARSLNRYLLEQNLLKKTGKVYTINSDFSNLFFIKSHKGKPSGVSLKHELLNWFKDRFKDAKFTQVKLDF